MKLNREYLADKRRNCGRKNINRDVPTQPARTPPTPFKQTIPAVLHLYGHIFIRINHQIQI